MRLVIVGGVAAGMSAATRARRMNESAEIVVLEKGGFISFANCGMPYFIAGRIRSSDDLLVTTAEKVRQRFNVDARTGHEVLSIDRARKTVQVRDLTQQREYELSYDKLILAPGGVPIVPPIPLIDSPNVMQLRTMEDTFRVDAFLRHRKPRHVTVIGAGFIGLEMTEALRDRGISVTLVEKAPMPLPPLDADMAMPLVDVLRKHDVAMHLGDGLAGFDGSSAGVTQVKLESGATIATDAVLLSIGVRPNTDLAKRAGLTIGPSGGIAVDEMQRTSDPDIYAAGDAAELVHGVTGKPSRIPLAGPANRQGRQAGEHAVCGSAAPAGRAIGTAILGLFDLAAAVTGLGENAARAAGYDIDTAIVVPNHHASYYPGAESMRLKIVYEKMTGRLLGGSAVGGKGVDKRIDVLATVLQFGGTIDDLTELDLAYAPQFGSAKDPVHMVGFVAQNQRAGISRGIAAAQLNGERLIDVRTPAEFSAGSLPGAINIPLDDLRGRLGEIANDQPVALFCKVGQRGYVAERILRQSGRSDVANLKGGYTLAREQPAFRHS